MANHAGGPDGIAAGPFGEWLAAMRAVLRGQRQADVPCGSCIGCCISAYPIPLRPEDTVARDQVPEQWLLGAAVPGERWLMGFREDGSCPFMASGRCGIYADRPQTCRDYDCRIYAAAGLVPAGPRPAIEARVRLWRFDYTAEADRQAQAAVQHAAGFIRQHAGLFPGPMRASSPTAAAVLAVKVYPLFMRYPEGCQDPAVVVERVLEMVRAFDSNSDG